MSAARERALMRRAFALAALAPPSARAFSVGAIACSAALDVLAEGFSREAGPAEHAEEAALRKLGGAHAHTFVCTLEPCLVRASKPVGCAQLLVEHGVRRVLYAVREDTTFVRQQGVEHLLAHGVEVRRIGGFEAEFRRINASLYGA